MSTGLANLVEKLSAFPRIGLVQLPTPLEPMKRLTEHLGGPRLWVKREDATGIGFGAHGASRRSAAMHWTSGMSRP